METSDGWAKAVEVEAIRTRRKRFRKRFIFFMFTRSSGECNFSSTQLLQQVRRVGQCAVVLLPNVRIQLSAFGTGDAACALPVTICALTSLVFRKAYVAQTNPQHPLKSHPQPPTEAGT